MLYSLSVNDGQIRNQISHLTLKSFKIHFQRNVKSNRCSAAHTTAQHAGQCKTKRLCSFNNADSETRPLVALLTQYK